MASVTGAILHNLALAAGPAAATALIFISCALVGTAAIPSRLRPAHARVALLAAVSVGAGVIGWMAWLAGSLVGTWAVPVVVGVLDILSLRRLPLVVLQTRRVFRELAALLRWGWGASIVVGAIVLLSIPNLLLPLADSDGLRYHVALPKLFLLTGKVFYYRYDVTGAFPQLAEMLNLLGLQLAGGETAKFLHWGFFLLTLAALIVIVHRGRRFRTAATLAPVFFAASPLAAALAAYAFVDFAALFHLAVGLLLTVTGGSPLLVGVVLGAALGTKYTAAPAVLAIALVNLVARRRRKLRLRTAAALACPVLVAFLPFGVRNTIATGDPFFPIGHGLIHEAVPGVTAHSLEMARDYHGSVPGLLGITWDLRQGPAQADEVPGAHHVLGFLALATVLVVPAARVLAAPVAASLAVGLLFHPPTRYLLPMFFCLSGLEAFAAGILIRRRMRAWATLLVTLPALVLSFRLLTQDFRPFDVLLGTRTRAAFLADTVPGWRAAQFVNSLPPGGRVMALDFPSPYYLNRPWIAEGMLNSPPLQEWLAQSRKADELLNRLHGAHVRYILVTPGYGGGTRYSLLPLAKTPSAQRLVLDLRRELHYVRTMDGVDIYAVPPAETGPRNPG